MYFLAVTKQETESIKKYFKRPNIKIIENPFDLIGKQINIQRKFIYFGRINQIKNIDLIIRPLLHQIPQKIGF